MSSHKLPPTLTHRLAGDQRARDSRHDSDAEDDDDVKKVRSLEILHLNVISWLFFSDVQSCVAFL